MKPNTSPITDSERGTSRPSPAVGKRVGFQLSSAVKRTRSRSRTAKTMVMMPTRTAFDSPYQTHMTIPVVLKPNYPWRGYTQGAYKDSLLRKQDWFNRLTAKPGGCVTFEVVPVGLAANVPYFFPYAKQGTLKTEIFAHTWTGYLQPEFTAIRADCVGAPD